MKVFPLLVFFFLLAFAAFGQLYNASRVFAHNDYEGPNPFHRAYDLQVGYIEADVFLQDGKLMVAHDKHEIRSDRTLERLYLEPLNDALSSNDGYAFKDTSRRLTLMIDLKTEGVPTLNAIVEALGKYPRITDSPTLQIMISGSVPDPALWERYPLYVHFDGRPGIKYSPDQWNRISMISTSFRNHVKWNGEGRLSDEARKTIDQLTTQAHTHGKKFRFWATPDFENAWREFKALNADVIVTDHVPEVVSFLQKH